MSFNPPPAGQTYSGTNERGFRDILRNFLSGVLRRDQDAELQPTARWIISSPNGTRWSITISDAGVISGTAL